MSTFSAFFFPFSIISSMPQFAGLIDRFRQVSMPANPPTKNVNNDFCSSRGALMKRSGILFNIVSYNCTDVGTSKYNIQQLTMFYHNRYYTLDH